MTSYLEEFKGKSIDVNGTQLPDRKILKISGTGVTGTDDSVNGRTTVTFAPNSFDFTNAEANGGNPTLKVGPEDTDQVSSLADTANADYDFSLASSGDGYYRFGVYVTVKRASTGDYLRTDAIIDGVRSSGTLTTRGSQVALGGGVNTGLTLTLSATGGNLRANLANATGETIDGYVWITWVKGDLI